MSEEPATKEARTFRSAPGVAVVFFLTLHAVTGEADLAQNGGRPGSGSEVSSGRSGARETTR